MTPQGCAYQATRRALRTSSRQRRFACAVGPRCILLTLAQHNERLAKERNPLGGLHKMAQDIGVMPPSSSPSPELRRLETEFRNFKKDNPDQPK